MDEEDQCRPASASPGNDAHFDVLYFDTSAENLKTRKGSAAVLFADVLKTPRASVMNDAARARKRSFIF